MKQRLIGQPGRFEFFQAVRLWLQLARRELRDAGRALSDTGHGARQAPRATGTPVAGAGQPGEELVRFRAHNTLTFPPAELHAVRTPQRARSGAPGGPADCDRLVAERADDEEPTPTSLRAEMVVTFLGLTGPNGALPRHYTQLVLERNRRKDYALGEFLDLFNHRVISSFYAAWQKYRFPVGVESADAGGAADELLFVRCLHCLVGLSDGESAARHGILRRRLDVSDDSLLYYGGFFAHRPRNAASLADLIEDYWNLPARIEQFHGQWLNLPADDQTRLIDDDDPSRSPPRLGVDVVVGERVWSVEQCFRVRLGPLSFAEFMRVTPLGDILVPLGQMIRQYVGPEFDFEIQPVLRADEVPACQLAEGDEGARLGWNSWLLIDPAAQDADDAVFVSEGGPTRFGANRER